MKFQINLSISFKWALKTMYTVIFYYISIDMGVDGSAFKRKNTRGRVVMSGSLSSDSSFIFAAVISARLSRLQAWGGDAKQFRNAFVKKCYHYFDDTNSYVMALCWIGYFYNYAIGFNIFSWFGNLFFF